MIVGRAALVNVAEGEENGGKLVLAEGKIVDEVCLASRSLYLTE